MPVKIVDILRGKESNASTAMVGIGSLMQQIADSGGLVNLPNLVVREDRLTILKPDSTPQAEDYVFAINNPENIEQLKQRLHEAAFAVLRNFHIESYEAIYDYCETTGQLQTLQRESWYLFFRLLRNALTHNGVWDFQRQSDRQKLPITWRGRTIDISMQGKTVPGNFFDWHMGIDMIEDMKNFAKSLN